MWRPLPVGKSEVRNAKPLISPLTRKLPRVPHSFFTSSGTRMITQFKRVPSRSRTDWNVLAVGFGMIPRDCNTGRFGDYDGAMGLARTRSLGGDTKGWFLRTGHTLRQSSFDRAK